MPDFTITITNEVGLHARPLALFVKEANNFQSEVTVTNVTAGKGPSNGKSPLSLLLLAVHKGMDIKVEAEGPDAQEALDALETLVKEKINK